MRVPFVCAAALALAGCDLMLGFGDPEPTPAPPPPPPTTPAPRCLAPGDLVEFPLIADTHLVDGDATAHGGEPLARLGDASLVLLRFEPGDVAFDQVQLTLTAPTHAIGCGAPGECAPCPSVSGGAFAVHRARPDWEERAATFTSRTSAEAWAAPGAGGDDRSALAGQASFMGDTLTLTLPGLPAPGATWPRGLALLLAGGGSGASAVLRAREALDSCGTIPAPQLVARCTAVSSCGDGVVDATETCDDGNQTAGDGCSDACQREGTCGDDVIEAPEQCDDGNDVGGDGCSATCAFEASCGNSFTEAGEACDDGNVLPGDGCSPSCTLENVCGNRIVEYGEQCDDGNKESFDGCTKDCRCEGNCNGWGDPVPV